MGCTASAAVGNETMIKSELRSGHRGKNSFHQDYLLAGRLGEGRFAQVHVALKANSNSAAAIADEECAVKVIDCIASPAAQEGVKPEQLDKKRVQAVINEVAILKRLDSTDVSTRIYDFYMEGGYAYIVMEKCDSSLLDALERLPEINEVVLKSFIRGMLQALVHVHELGIVHRDVKPDNFLCSRQGAAVRLCDFGVGVILDEGDHAGKPSVKGVCGTAPFMSPEMLAKVPYGPATDVWSVGVILHVLLTGKFPYMPAEMTSQAMKDAIITGRAISDAGPRASASATSLVCELVCRDPSTRPTASQALDSWWLSPNAHTEARTHSLALELRSAKRVGAFSAESQGKRAPTTVDWHLRSMQRSYHGVKSIFDREAAKWSDPFDTGATDVTSCSTRPGSVDEYKSSQAS